MRRISPYFVFAVAYAALAFVASFTVEKLGTGAMGAILAWCLPLTMGPVALWVSSRLGVLTSTGVALTSCIVVLCVFAAILSILLAIAAPSVDLLSVAHITQTFTRFVQLSGRVLWLNTFMVIAVPWLWSLFLFWRRSHITRVGA